MRVFVFHPVLVYIFNYCNIIIKKKKYIYIYIHPHKQTKKPCFLCQNSTLVIDRWKRAINSDFVLFVVTYGDYKDLSNSMLYKGFGYRTLLNLYRSDINNLVPVYFTHTHTHTHIYIYIYIYMVSNYLYLVVVWFILVSLGSFCCNLVYNWILFILLKIKNWK